MRKSRFTPEQMQALRQAESGTPVVEICRKLGRDRDDVLPWKKRYAGLDGSELRELKQIREENRRLKSLVADLSLPASETPNAILLLACGTDAANTGCPQPPNRHDANVLSIRFRKSCKSAVTIHLSI